jgi:GntR family transcriptional regulator / MocR family aminotransferase
MAKRAGDAALALAERTAGTPAYRWLYDALRAAILSGRLPSGARLPSTRDLAAQVGLSRGTAIAAYAQLTSEGYVDGTVGSGTYVSAVLPDDLLQAAPRSGAIDPLPPNPARRFSEYAARVIPFRSHVFRPGCAFRPNAPALDQFPTALWGQLAARTIRRASAKLLLGGDPMGYAPLRAAIADYLARSRGVSCNPEQVMIVSGAQEALDLVARLVLNPGDRVCAEDPGYGGAFGVFRAVGARVVGVPVDDEGMVLRRSQLRGARLVYVTPAHQYPLGVAMSLSRRLALLEWARATGALVFEDDYDSEYRYAGRPLPALQSLDRSGHVLFAGSFNKVLFPALRLGYLVVPADLVDRFAAALSLTRRFLPLLEQAVVCDLITEGHFGRHLRRMRQLYAERLSVLIECARRQLTGLLEISPVLAGLETIGWLARGLSGETVAEAARARNVAVLPLRRFYLGAMPRDGLQLGFAAVNEREIRRGVHELARVLAGARSPRTRAQPARRR